MSTKTDISQRQDLTIKRRDTFDLDIEVFNSSNEPYDFTSCTAKMEIRALGSDGSVGAVALTLETGDGITLTLGNIALLIAAADTDLDPTVTYTYDIQVTLANGKVKTFVRGDIIVNNDVTA